MINDSRFLPLKDMQRFTEDMFNRIIDFQEKKHLAWDVNAAFAERIDNLPLHYFIFSNYDRDPDKQGPTLTHYYPLKVEMHKLAHYLRCAGCHEVIDYYPGNGLLGSLLAKAAQLTAIGLEFNNQKASQIAQFYDSACYQMRHASDQFTANDTQGYFVSWTPSGSNPVPDLLSKKARLIIFVGTEHSNPETGQRQVGVDNMFDALAEDYRLWDSWEVIRPENLLHKIWPDMTPNIEEIRQVRVYARNDLAPAKSADADEEAFAQQDPGYFWESELRMAELATQAMNSLQHMPFAR